MCGGGILLGSDADPVFFLEGKDLGPTILDSRIRIRMLLEDSGSSQSGPGSANLVNTGGCHTKRS